MSKRGQLNLRLQRVINDLDAIVAFEQQEQSRVINDDDLMQRIKRLSREVSEITRQLEPRPGDRR